MSSHPMRERHHQRLWSQTAPESGPSEICAVGVLEHEGTPTPAAASATVPQGSGSATAIGREVLASMAYSVSSRQRPDLLSPCRGHLRPALPVLVRPEARLWPDCRVCRLGSSLSKCAALRADQGPWSRRRDARTTTKAGLRRPSQAGPSVAPPRRGCRTNHSGTWCVNRSAE